MSYEELGLSYEDQLNIRARAVWGAIHDEFAPIQPIRDGFLAREVSANVEMAIENIISERGVSEAEAQLIYAEQLLLERKGVQE